MHAIIIFFFLGSNEVFSVQFSTECALKSVITVKV